MPLCKNFVFSKNIVGPFTTNTDGLAVLSYNSSAPSTLIARKGKDISFMKDVRTFSVLPEEEIMLWHVFDDRRYEVDYLGQSTLKLM